MDHELIFIMQGGTSGVLLMWSDFTGAPSNFKTITLFQRLFKSLYFTENLNDPVAKIVLADTRKLV
jgi:hypothetical protein